MVGVSSFGDLDIVILPKLGDLVITAGDSQGNETVESMDEVDQKPFDDYTNVNNYKLDLFSYTSEHDQSIPIAENQTDAV